MKKKIIMIIVCCLALLILGCSADKETKRDKKDKKSKKEKSVSVDSFWEDDEDESLGVPPAEIIEEEEIPENEDLASVDNDGRIWNLPYTYEEYYNAFTKIADYYESYDDVSYRIWVLPEYDYDNRYPVLIVNAYGEKKRAYSIWIYNGEGVESIRVDSSDDDGTSGDKNVCLDGIMYINMGEGYIYTYEVFDDLGYQKDVHSFYKLVNNSIEDVCYANVTYNDGGYITFYKQGVGEIEKEEGERLLQELGGLYFEDWLSLSGYETYNSLDYFSSDTATTVEEAFKMFTEYYCGWD